MNLNPDNAFTAWVCVDCYLTHAGYSPDEIGHDFAEVPMGLVETGTVVTTGMLDRDHKCEDHNVGHRSDIGCGEEEIDFSTQVCDGCATTLAGTRHALTFWESRVDHDHFYDRALSAWQCRDCDTATDYCQQINPS